MSGKSRKLDKSIPAILDEQDIFKRHELMAEYYANSCITESLGLQLVFHVFNKYKDQYAMLYETELSPPEHLKLLNQCFQPGIQQTILVDFLVLIYIIHIDNFKEQFKPNIEIHINNVSHLRSLRSQRHYGINTVTNIKKMANISESLSKLKSQSGGTRRKRKKRKSFTTSPFAH